VAQQNDARETGGIASTEQVVLEISAWKGNAEEPAGLPELIERFESEHPGVSIELTYISRIDSELVLGGRLGDGDPPDVIMTDMQLADLFSREDLLVDFGIDTEWHSRLPEDLRSALTIGDSSYIMPFESIGMGNFVNVDLLARAGITQPPLTVDELLVACHRLADADIKPLIFTGGFSAALFLVANGLEGAGSSAAALGSGEARFADSASFVAGVDLIRDLIAARCFDPEEQAGLDSWSTALTAFSEGQVAMMPQGAWNIAAFSEVDDLNYVFTPIPSARSMGVALDLFGIGWSIPVGAEHSATARTFVDWCALPQQIQVVLDAEAAYTPFDDGSSGTPRLARAYDEARASGAAISYPVALLQWPSELETEIWDSLTALLLDPTLPTVDVLSRWDRVVDEAAADG